MDSVMNLAASGWRQRMLLFAVAPYCCCDCFLCCCCLRPDLLPVLCHLWAIKVHFVLLVGNFHLMDSFRNVMASLLCKNRHKSIQLDQNYKFMRNETLNHFSVTMIIIITINNNNNVADNNVTMTLMMVC